MSILFLIIFFNLLVNFFRQVFIYRRISRHLEEEQGRLQVLVRRNEELEKRLELVKNRDFLEGGTEAIFKSENDQLSMTNLGGETKQAEPGMSNYEKWWRLFVY